MFSRRKNIRTKITKNHLCFVVMVKSRSRSRSAGLLKKKKKAVKSPRKPKKVHSHICAKCPKHDEKISLVYKSKDLKTCSYVEFCFIF